MNIKNIKDKILKHSNIIATIIISLLFCYGVNFAVNARLAVDDNNCAVLYEVADVPVQQDLLFLCKIVDISEDKIIVASMTENTPKMQFMELLPVENGFVEENTYKTEDYGEIFAEINKGDCKIIDEYGTEKTSQYLKTGMIAYVTCESINTQTTPCTFTGVKHIKIDKRDLNFSELYFDVTSRLNIDNGERFGNLNVLAFDLNGVYNLTQAEKNAFVYKIQREFGVQAFLATYDDLEQTGLISKDSQTFKNGALFTIELPESAQNQSDNSELSFSISKWQSDTCAVGYPSCTAKYNPIEEKWEFVSMSKWIF